MNITGTFTSGRMGKTPITGSSFTSNASAINNRPPFLSVPPAQNFAVVPFATLIYL